MASPRPGDIIKHRHTCRWGIYVGDDTIVHLSLGGATQAKVKKDLLSNNGKNKYQVDNMCDDECKPLPADKIVDQALKMVGKTVPYGSAAEDCKDFVVCMRYGKEWPEKNWMLKVLDTARWLWDSLFS